MQKVKKGKLKLTFDSMEYVSTEYEEQVTFAEWLEANNFKFTAIPNSTYTPSYNQKRRNHASGLRPGLPDLLVVLPGKGLAFVEMKRTKRSKVQPVQQDWIDTLNEVPGVEAKVCYGAKEAIEFIKSII